MYFSTTCLDTFCYQNKNGQSSSSFFLSYRCHQWQHYFFFSLSHSFALYHLYFTSCGIFSCSQHNFYCAIVFLSLHKIRPGIWYAEDTARTDYTVFESLEDFISAIEEAVFQNPKTHNNAGTWKAAFFFFYKQETGIDLSIPRWSEIKDKYDLKSVRKLEKAKSDLAKATDQYEKIKERIQLYHQKLHAEQEKNNAGKVGKIQDDIEKQKKNAEKAKEKINKAQAKIDELEG